MRQLSVQNHVFLERDAGLLIHLLCRRGKWMQSDADSSIYEVVSTTDWFQLLATHASGAEDQPRYAHQSCLPFVCLHD